MWRFALGHLPSHGRISCSKCYPGEPVTFDKTRNKSSDGNWRITANPLAWGNSDAVILVLGFSKGQTQTGGILKQLHDDIAFKSRRANVGRILAHIGLVKKSSVAAQKLSVDRMIADKDGLFHFGSLVRCPVERFDSKKQVWTGSGGGMLGKFVKTPFGRGIAENCASTFLRNLPASTKLIVMFGLGTELGYVHAAKNLISEARQVSMKWINDVAYEDDQVTVVHVEHFASQGPLISQWLGEKEQRSHDRSRFGTLAGKAVEYWIDKIVYQ